MNMQGGSNDALPRQVTIKQASKIWGIPEWTLRKYISQRRCPHRRVYGRIYIPTKRFQEWLEECDVVK